MKILILRNFADKVSANMYNLQEVGLAKSLIKLGNKCDIVFYTSNHKIEIQRIAIKDDYVNIFWVPALRIMKDAIYFKLIKTRFFDKYDIVQTSAYSYISRSI
jgi:hypothetical protein